MVIIFKFFNSHCEIAEKLDYNFFPQKFQPPETILPFSNMFLYTATCNSVFSVYLHNDVLK